MTTGDDIELPTGKELTKRWAQMSRPMQGNLWRKVRSGESSEDKHEALLIAAMAQQRLRDWTMRPEIVIPAFVGVLFLFSFIIEGFSFGSSLMAPIVYSGYLLWMRSSYKRAYRRNMEVLRGEGETDSGA